MSKNESAVRMVEIGDESLVVTFTRPPRISSGQNPIFWSETVVVAVDDEPTQALIDDFRLAINDLGRDLLDAVSEGNTQTLDEFEMAQDDDELDLGMGDPHV
jgi:hypothetical protein